MDPVTLVFLVFGVLAGGTGLKWWEMSMVKATQIAKTKEIETPKLDVDDKELACPYYFNRDYEDRAIAAGIMTEDERDLCDDCKYCNDIRDDRNTDALSRLVAKQKADEALRSRGTKSVRVWKRNECFVEKIYQDYTYTRDTGLR